MIEPIDTESRTLRSDHLSLRVWLRLLACTNLIEARTRTRLRRNFTTTLPRFDFMAQLERHPGGLTMSELSRRLMVTGGNVTRLADELERDGSVAREASRDDRRVSAIRLTASGRRAFAAMAQQHERWIVEMFAGLSHKDRTQLFELLAKLKAHLLERESAP